VYKTGTGQWKVAITIRTLDGSSKKITRNATSQRHGLMILDELRAEYKQPADDPQFVRVTALMEKFLSSLEIATSTLDAYRTLLRNHMDAETKLSIR
jgi:hypothetical protein